MSEGCTSCRGANYAGTTLQLSSTSGGGTGTGSSASPTSCTTTRRVQVRAKVLYGSGKAIASLQAQEKAARHWEGTWIILSRDSNKKNFPKNFSLLLENRTILKITSPPRCIPIIESFGEPFDDNPIRQLIDALKLKSPIERTNHRELRD